MARNLSEHCFSRKEGVLKYLYSSVDTWTSLTWQSIPQGNEAYATEPKVLATSDSETASAILQG